MPPNQTPSSDPYLKTFELLESFKPCQLLTTQQVDHILEAYTRIGRFVSANRAIKLLLSVYVRSAPHEGFEKALKAKISQPGFAPRSALQILCTQVIQCCSKFFFKGEYGYPAFQLPLFQGSHLLSDLLGLPAKVTPQNEIEGLLFTIYELIGQSCRRNIKKNDSIKMFGQEMLWLTGMADSIQNISPSNRLDVLLGKSRQQGQKLAVNRYISILWGVVSSKSLSIQANEIASTFRTCRIVPEVPAECYGVLCDISICLVAGLLSRVGNIGTAMGTILRLLTDKDDSVELLTNILTRKFLAKRKNVHRLISPVFKTQAACELLLKSPKLVINDLLLMFIIVYQYQFAIPPTKEQFDLVLSYLSEDNKSMLRRLVPLSIISPMERLVSATEWNLSALERAALHKTPVVKVIQIINDLIALPLSNSFWTNHSHLLSLVSASILISVNIRSLVRVERQNRFRASQSFYYELCIKPSSPQGAKQGNRQHTSHLNPQIDLKIVLINLLTTLLNNVQLNLFTSVISQAIAVKLPRLRSQTVIRAIQNKNVFLVRLFLLSGRKYKIVAAAFRTFGLEQDQFQELTGLPPYLGRSIIDFMMSKSSDQLKLRLLEAGKPELVGLADKSIPQIMVQQLQGNIK